MTDNDNNRSDEQPNPELPPPEQDPLLPMEGDSPDDAAATEAYFDENEPATVSAQAAPADDDDTVEPPPAFVRQSPPPASPPPQREGGGIPGWVWWVGLIILLLIVIFSLRGIEAPITPPQITATAEAQLRTDFDQANTDLTNAQATATEQSAMLDLLQNDMDVERTSVFATITAADATREALEQRDADAAIFRETADANDERRVRVESAATQQNDRLMNATSTMQAMEVDMNTLRTDLEDGANARATLEAQLAEAEESLSDAQTRLGEIEGEVITFQADATTRALAAQDMRATVEAAVETADELRATATAQAELVATQQAQLEEIRDALGTGEDD